MGYLERYRKREAMYLTSTPARATDKISGLAESLCLGDVKENRSYQSEPSDKKSLS